MRWYDHNFHTPGSLKIVFSIIPRLPKLLHPLIAFFTAMIFFFILGKERHAVIENLRIILKSGAVKRSWTAFRVFYSFCDFIVSYCYVPNASHSELLKMMSRQDNSIPTIVELLRDGRGLIVWTAHFGNWEYGSRLLEMSGVQVNVARVVETEKPAESALRNMMSNDKLRIIQLRDGPFASLELFHALRRNEIVAIQGDRIYQDYNVGVTFFGKEAIFPLGPFFLAYISGAPLLPALIVRDKWLRYRVILGDIIRLDRDVDKDHELKRALERVVSFLEANIREFPNQWLNFFSFWEPAQGDDDVASDVDISRNASNG